jgi:hypothetical protein
MGLKAPPSNVSLTNTITITPPPHTTQQQVSPFSLFQILLSPPYVYIFIALAVLFVVFIVVFLAFRKSYAKDPIRNGLIRQIRRSKNVDVVVVNIDVSTRSAQLYVGQKLSPSLYAVQDPVTGEELIIPVTSESMVGMIQYGKIHRPLLITIRKGNTMPYAIRLETLETSIPVSEYDTAEPELLAQLAKVKKMITGSITLSPSTKLAIAVDPKLLLSRRLSQELEILSTIPTTVKEMNANLVKLLKLQNEGKRVQTMGRIMLYFVIGMIAMMFLAVLFGLHII